MLRNKRFHLGKSYLLKYRNRLQIVNEEKMVLFIVRVIITTIVILLVSHHLPGLEIKNMLDAIFFGIILGTINSVVRPVLTLLTLPITLEFILFFFNISSISLVMKGIFNSSCE